MTAAAPARARPRALVPEVVQTSMMDCGPAALQALVAGFGLDVNYGRLREACQTGVDGTSITAMDEIANLLGLDTEEMMLPAEHLLLAEAAALPAIAVIRTPGGANHFVVVWSIAGPWVQIMDPAEGRQFVRRADLLDRLYVHQAEVPAETWRGWAGEPEFLGALEVRLGALAIPAADRARLAAAALADPSWRALAALDAATRMTAALADGGAVERGPACRAFVERLITADADGDYPLILGEYRSVTAAAPAADGEAQVRVSGAAIVRARGRHAPAPRAPAEPPPAAEAPPAAPSEAPPAADGEPARPPAASLPPELAAALAEPEARPGRTLLGMLLADGLLTPLALAGAAGLAALLVAIDALLLRGLLELGGQLGLASQRAIALAAVLGLLALGLAVELPLVAGALRLGRLLDLRLRMAFLAKIPRLDDRYFRSRLLSDMAERGHSLHAVRAVPVLGTRVLSAASQLVLTVAGIIWLSPASAPLAILAAAVSVGLPLACQPILAERELRVRSHAGAVGRYYLDALLGLLPIRVHGARAAVFHQQGALLAQWEHAGLRYHAAATAVEGALSLCGLGAAVAMVWQLADGAQSGVLLLVYWALSVPAIGQDLALIARQYPVLRNVVGRLLEPLGTPEPIAPAGAPPRPAAPATAGARIELVGVTVEAAGATVLADVELAVAPGEHVAIVGASGAGKSSLVGLLLGWYRPARGAVQVDGEPLFGDALRRLRQATAWVDPAIALWNRSLLDNLSYGSDDPAALAIGGLIAEARLTDVLANLPDGLATELGEGGGLVSGGEGQRVRVARALARAPARLAVLDEPFRGLDQATRRALLATARARWAQATLLWVTHDIVETLALPRVIVLDGGRVIEDGDPRALAARPGSAYAALLAADREMHAEQWSPARWRQIWVERGVTREDAGGS